MRLATVARDDSTRHSSYVLRRLALLSLTVLVGCTASAHSHNSAGVQQLSLGRYHEAIQNFQEALVSDPDNADAYYNLAATYYDLGKRNNDQNLLGQAEGLYHQCLDLDPDHADCHRGLAALLVDTNRSESAFTLLKRWAMRNPYHSEARIELARLYEEFGDQEGAIRHLTDALQLNAQNSRAWTALGRLREHRGELAQALSNYQQAYNINRYQPGITDRIAAVQQRIAMAPATTSSPPVAR